MTTESLGDTLRLEIAGATAPGKKEIAIPPKNLSPEQKQALLTGLATRFVSESERYCEGIELQEIKNALNVATEEQLYGLYMMEIKGHKVRVIRANENGRKGFRFDSCSTNSPEGVQGVNYYEAEKIAKEWGIDLQNPRVFEELTSKYGFNQRGPSDHLKTDPITLEGGISVYGGKNGVCYTSLADPSFIGGFRGSLWIAEAQA